MEVIYVTLCKITITHTHIYIGPWYMTKLSNCGFITRYFSLTVQDPHGSTSILKGTKYATIIQYAKIKFHHHTVWNTDRAINE
jgi:hypothetical protein